MALPLVGDADAAGEPDPAIHDQEFPVRAVVEAPEVVPLEGPVHLDVDTGIAKLLQQRILDLYATHPVEHDLDFDARLRALGQGVRELSPDVARPVDVGLEVDGALCRADGFQHRRKDLVAVLQVGHTVARDDGRTEQHGHLAAELRVRDRVAVRDAPLDPLFGRDEIHRDDDAEHRHGSRITMVQRIRFRLRPMVHGTCPTPSETLRSDPV